MPVESMQIVTEHADVAHDVLNQLFAPVRPIRFLGRGSDLRFELDSRTVRDLGSDTARYGMAAEAQAPPAEEFLAMTVLDGAVDLTSGSHTTVLRTGDTARFPHDHEAVSRWREAKVLITRVPRPALDRVAQAHHGVRPGGVRFEGIRPLSHARARQWESLARHVDAVLRTSPPDADLVHAHLAEVVAATALTVFGNSTMCDRPASGGSVRTAALRRAVAYIDEHAAEPITLADLAAAAGTTGRALQASFRRHHGCSPTAYLRTARLQGARGELAAADNASGVTVAEIAARWGFGHPARFARVYRDAFGELPSRTLRG